MWIFLSDAFISVVAHRDDGNLLLVRARLDGDLERAFSRIGIAPVVQTLNHADYRFRTTVDRSTFERLLTAAAREIVYDNFKNQIADDDALRHDAYFRVWETMHTAQRQARAKADADGAD